VNVTARCQQKKCNHDTPSQCLSLALLQTRGTSFIMGGWVCMHPRPAPMDQGVGERGWGGGTEGGGRGVMQLLTIFVHAMSKASLIAICSMASCASRVATKYCNYPRETLTRSRGTRTSHLVSGFSCCVLFCFAELCFAHLC